MSDRLKSFNDRELRTIQQGLHMDLLYSSNDGLNQEIGDELNERAEALALKIKASEIHCKCCGSVTGHTE